MTCSVNLVLLGKTCFTVHTKMGVILALPGFDLPLTAVSTRTGEGVQVQVAVPAGPISFLGRLLKVLWEDAVGWMNYPGKTNPHLTITASALLL